MKHKRSRRSILVGIDGSQAAIHAAEWAVDEAIDCDIPLRLIYVIERSSLAVRLQTEYAEAALRTACASVAATGKHVKIETAIERGRTNVVLAKESRDAGMLAVGSLGTGYPNRKLLGSTAAALAQSAHCPVAVVRTPKVSQPESGCIVVGLEDSHKCDTLLEVATDEARLRKVPLVVLGGWPSVHENSGDDHVDQRIAHWRRQCPDVDVNLVGVRTSVADFLAETDRTVLVAIVDNDAGHEGTRLASPAGTRSVLFHAYCSVLVIRP